MYYDLHIPLGSYRDFEEIIQAHDRIYSDNASAAELGCEQIYGWLSKSARSQPFFEITALLSNNLIKNSKNLLGGNSFTQFFNSLKHLINKILSEFPSDFEYYQNLSQYAFSEYGYFPPKDELLSFSSALLAYLDKNFWTPNIKIHQRIVEDSTKHISEYFENEEGFQMSKTNFLFYFVPILAKEFCKDCKEKVDDKELIFGFTRPELMEKFPNFIKNAIEFTEPSFADSFAFEFSDYFIQGSNWASKVLDMLFENKLCSMNIISNYILCAPNKNQQITDFLKKHDIQITEANDNFWCGVPMGFNPYQYDEYNIDLNPNSEIDRSHVGILHEEKRYYNAKNGQNNNYNKKNSYPKNSAQVSSFAPTKIQQQPRNTQVNSSNNNFKPSSSSKPNTDHPPENAHHNTDKPKPDNSHTQINNQGDQHHRNSHDNVGDNNGNSNKPKPIVITSRPKDKKLEITKPNEKK